MAHTSPPRLGVALIRDSELECGMRKQDAVSYFKTQKALAAAIGYAESTVSEWGEVVPLAAAALIERATRGRRKVDYSLYRRARA